MTLRGRRIKCFFELWWLVGSGGFTIWVSSASFQKSSIVWPQQPLPEKVLKFNVILLDSTQNFFFSKHPNKADLNNMDDSEVPSSGFPGLRTSMASMTSTASTTSMASMTSSASFHQKNTDHDGGIIPGTKMTNDGPFLWNGSSKIPFFTNIWYPFCRRLLRPASATFLKTGWWNTNG